MKGAKKHFSRALTLLLSVLIMLQTVTVPAFAAENTTENVEVATNDASTEEESTFNLINADVQIDDEYGNEADYISEVQIPDLEQISEETLVENGVSIHSDYPGDAMVYLTQRWLNQEYGDVPGFGYVTEDGRTGWDTVYGLTRALQVELGIADLADNFGPTTERLYSQNLLRRQDGVTNRKFAILQGALWCKGYNPGYNLSETEDGTVVFNGVFDADVEKAIIELKEDAGLINPDGVVTVNIMKALMSMDSFKLLSSYGGTAAVREMQQKLNRKYEAYTGITPCDGVYGRNTNRALIYALQAEEGMPTDVANANFGVTTRLCCPEIPYARNSSSARRYPGTSSGSYYSAAQITSITELLQFALLVNGYNVGAIDGEYGPATKQALYDFQAKMKITPTGYADKTTWLSLFVSCGDTSRSALAADCATQLTAAKAKTLYDNGYRYIGRYLTGNSKKITRTEAQIIFDAGLKFFPIYQSSANYLEYFTPQQGADDAQKAKKAATELGLPENTIIYFAVDFDCLDYQITNNVIPYFERVHNEMADMDRTATNRSVLMYRVYDGASWGAAQPVLDDSTADFEPYIFSDGNGGAHVIWQNCNSVLGPNATLDEMAAAMDLYYTYWNGTSFVNTTAITANNANYEMSHRIVSSGDSISVIWQQNSENDVFALNGTNSIFRKQYVNGAWENTEVIASGLTVVTSIDTAYADGNNVVAYTAKTNSDSSDISDLEVFYYNGSETIRLTNDSIPDYSVSLLNNELYWISGDSIACISNGNVETRCTIVSELNSNVTRIKALKNSGGKKAIVWQQECDSDVNFYGVNYNDVTSAFGTVEPISTDSGIVRGWDACMLPNGQIELAYGFAEKLQEAVNGKPYGQIDLVQKTANRFYDVHVDPVVSYSGIIEPNKDISIHINVLNNGSMDINQFTVKILDTDNTTLQTYTIDHDLAVGDSGELEIPFTLPASIEKTNYTIQVYPAGQKDVFDSDNEAILTIGFADISIDNIQESRTEAGRTLTVTVKNSGYTTVNSATLKFFKVTDDRTLISTERIESLDPGAEETFRFSIGMDEFSNDVSGETKTYFFLVETEELESDRGNNSEFVYLHPDYDITLIAGSGGNVSGSGTYVKGNDAILIATPLSGYIFDGWYENGELLYGVSNEYEITVDSNRTLEARFKENDLQITDVEIFGTLAAGETISFTVSATGGVQPWQWEFYIQSDNEVVYSDNAAIVNFMEWTPSQSGTYDFLAFVTDATGKRISYRTQFVVS